MKKVLSIFMLIAALATNLVAYQNSPILRHSLGAAGALVEAPGEGFGTIMFQVTGTWSGTITFEGTITGTWVAINATNVNSGTAATTTTSNGLYWISSVGLVKVRARMSSYTSGTASISGVAVDGIPSASLSSSGGSGGDVNLTGINGVTPSTGNGTAGTGTPRVTIASNNTPFSVNIKDSAGNYVAGAAQYAEDAAHASGDYLFMAGAVRRDTPASSSGTDGDNSTINVDSEGRAWVNAGQAAHDSPVSGRPVLEGNEARTSDGTAVGNGDAVRAMADVFGKRVVLPGCLTENIVENRINVTDSTAATVISAAGANVKIAVYSYEVTNAHATVGTKVEIRDGTTVKRRPFAAANGGGAAPNGGGVPIWIGTANTAVTARAVTTGSDIEVAVTGCKIGN